ncbi:hypothetical protein ACFZAC_03180 [Pseudomonas fluorescens]|uniref:hypothetical protein n=1 Tax=Pseudomonas fluorescens TaxID=294 RepID=UPI0037497117
MNNFHRLTIFAVCIGLVACSSRPERGAVVQQWSANTEQLNFKPIFPPRGNFEVGDFYVVRAAKAGNKMKTADYYMSSVWFDRMRLDEELKKAAPYVTAEKTPVDKSGLVTATTVPDLFVPNTKVKMNALVAFPGFTFASLAESDIGLGVSNSAIGAFFGGARKSGYSVAYSVPMAETYGVLYSDAHLAADKYLSKYTDAQRNKLTNAVVSLKNDSKVNDKNDTTSVLVLVTQVYLARSLDVVVSSTESNGAQLSAVTRALTDLDERKTAIENQLRALKPAAKGDGAVDGKSAEAKTGETKAAVDTPAVAVPTTNQAIVKQKEAELAQVNADIRKRVESVTPAMPGVTGSVVKSSMTSLTLRQVFDTPVAIGYSGINIDIDTLIKDRKVVEAANIDTFPLKQIIKVNLE